MTKLLRRGIFSNIFDDPQRQNYWPDPKQFAEYNGGTDLYHNAKFDENWTTHVGVKGQRLMFFFHFLQAGTWVLVLFLLTGLRGNTLHRPRWNFSGRRELPNFTLIGPKTLKISNFTNIIASKVKNLLEIERRTSVWDNKVWCFSLFYYQQDCPKGSSVSILFA